MQHGQQHANMRAIHLLRIKSWICRNACSCLCDCCMLSTSGGRAQGHSGRSTHLEHGIVLDSWAIAIWAAGICTLHAAFELHSSLPTHTTSFQFAAQSPGLGCRQIQVLISLGTSYNCFAQATAGHTSVQMLSHGRWSCLITGVLCGTVAMLVPARQGCLQLSAVQARTSPAFTNDRMTDINAISDDDIGWSRHSSDTSGKRTCGLPPTGCTHAHREHEKHHIVLTPSLPHCSPEVRLNEDSSTVC